MKEDVHSPSITTGPIAAPAAASAAAPVVAHGTVDPKAVLNLVASDDIEFEIIYAEASLSELLKDLVASTGTDMDIPLAKVTGAILQLVVDFLRFHYEQVKSAAIGDKAKVEIAEWPKIQKITTKQLFDLILAANYLYIKPLLDLTCRTVANNVKGKAPNEICKMFGVTEPFTPEEEENVFMKNPWLKG